MIPSVQPRSPKQMAIPPPPSAGELRAVHVTPPSVEVITCSVGVEEKNVTATNVPPPKAIPNPESLRGHETVDQLVPSVDLRIRSPPLNTERVNR